MGEKSPKANEKANCAMPKSLDGTELGGIMIKRGDKVKILHADLNEQLTDEQLLDYEKTVGKIGTITDVIDIGELGGTITVD
ncbi:MAG: hypothetical protein ACTSRU_17540, partial [Candidatus Hodarchaeales archaeon]